MALTHARSLEQANSVVLKANAMKKAYEDLKEVISTNNALAIDWAGNPKPAYINEDADGNVDGVKCSRAQIANCIGSFAAIVTLLEDSGHLGNINLVADADV